MSRPTIFDAPGTAEPEAEHKPGLPPCVECGDPAPWGDRGRHFCTLCRPRDFLDLARQHSAEIARERA